MGHRGWNAGKGWVTEWQTTATIGRSLKTVESSINQAAAIEGYLQTLRFYLFFLPRAERNYFLPSSSARYLEFLRVRRADQLVIQEQLIFAGSPWVSSDWLFLMKMLFADEVWKFFSRSIPFLTVNEDLNLIETAWRGFSMWKRTWTPAQHATTIMWKSCLFVKWESMRTKPSSEREKERKSVCAFAPVWTWNESSAAQASHQRQGITQSFDSISSRGQMLRCNLCGHAGKTWIRSDLFYDSLISPIHPARRRYTQHVEAASNNIYNSGLESSL